MKLSSPRKDTEEERLNKRISVVHKPTINKPKSFIC